MIHLVFEDGFVWWVGQLTEAEEAEVLSAARSESWRWSMGMEQP